MFEVEPTLLGGATEVLRRVDATGALTVRAPRAHADDEALRGFGVRPIRTPYRAPMANAYCERLIGTIRRECLDYLIPLNQRHLRGIVKEFARYYNRGRPHSALGPGIPEPLRAKVPAGPHRHKLPAGYRVNSTRVLGGLHHEYGLEKEAA